MHILPMRLFLPLAQEIVLRILGRCFKDQPLRATTLFHKLWASTQMVIYRKGHIGSVCLFVMFLFLMLKPLTCGVVQGSSQLVPPHFLIPFPYISLGQADLFVIPGLPTSWVRPVLFLPVENAFLSPLCLSGTYSIFQAQLRNYSIFQVQLGGQCFHIASMPRPQL